ncbi:hypothetical protein [Ureaplasma ceti]|uniref:DinF protein n=1 Tax=Ureaplasma ceti TaxID=3119530 RepID=A0ABP9UBR5_9BACT
MISATIPGDGAYYVIGIGYVTAFQLAYVQIGWSVSIAITYTLIQMKFTKSDKVEGQSQGDMMFVAIVITWIYGLVLVPLFVGPSYAYSKFANDHVNTLISQKSAYVYIYTLAGYIFLSPFISLLILFIHSYKGQKISITVMILSNLLIVGMSAILTLTPKANNDIKAMGTGLGMTIGSLIVAIVLSVYVFLTTELRYSKFKFKAGEILFVIKQTMKLASTILFIQIFKAVALIVMGLVISDTMQSVVPMGYQYGRVIWYNYVYLIPFFCYGIGDAMMFFGLRKKIEIKYQQMFVAFIVIIVTCFLIEAGIAIGLRWTVEPLSTFYTKNSQLDWSTIDLDKVNLSFMLMKIAQKKNIDQSYVNQILNIIEADPYGTQKLQEFLKYSIVSLLSSQNMNGPGLASMILYPKSRSYIFISVYAVFYSTASMMNNIASVMKRRYPTAFESVRLMVVQAIALTAIITCGLELQSGTTFPMLDAWSFPMFIIGIVSLLYFSIEFAKTCIEIEKEFKGRRSDFIVLNEYDNIPNREDKTTIISLNDENLVSE